MKLWSCSFLAIACALCAGCSSVTEGSIQDVTVVTPGANNAECKVSAGGVKYIYNPPMTRGIQKTGETMVVDCWAPGNRHEVVYIKPTVSTSAFYNAGTGMVPGLAWDYASKAMYDYPKVVNVDFTHAEIREFPLPAQNLDDVHQPEDHDLEEFSPSLPRLNSDRYATAPEIRRREIPTDFDLQGFAETGDKNQAGAKAYNFDDQGGDTAGVSQTSKIRVIGKLNEGISVPVPPAPGQNTNDSSSQDSRAEASTGPVKQGAEQGDDQQGNGGQAAPDAPAAAAMGPGRAPPPLIPGR